VYVVLDSNIWISELGLRSALGAATRFYLKRHRAVLVVPEVIRLEAERNLRNLLQGQVQSIHDAHSRLLSVFGRLKEIVLPSGSDIEHIVSGLFAEADVEFQTVPFSLESARASFLKTIDKIAPSDKSQQFKDGVLWADCVRLLDKSDVHLVTADKAFYENRNYKDGLAQNLSEEVTRAPNALFLHPTLHSLLEQLHTRVEISPEDLLQRFMEAHGNSVSRVLERMGFELGPIAASLIRPFATEKSDEIYVEFELAISCTPTTEDGRSDGQLILKGDGRLNLEPGTYSELRNYGEEFKYTTAEGTEESTKNTVIFVDSLVIGHKEVQYSVRHELE